MKAIILAAGKGGRLLPLTENYPKTLVKVNNKPMLQYLIDNLLENDIRDIIICVGFQSNKIKEFCKKKYPMEKIKFVENRDYEITNNMYSLYLAKEFFDDDLIIMNADLVYESDVIKKLKEHSGSSIAVDKGNYNEESMKIIVEDNIIKSISKKHSDCSYGCSIDVYKIVKKDLIKILKEMNQIIEIDKDRNQWTELMLDNLFLNNKIIVHPVDINGSKWFEIDNFEDLNKAEIIFNEEKIINLKKKKIFFVDGDGTLYVGNNPINKGKDFIKTLQKDKIVYFITNNSSKTPKQHKDSLEEKGILFDEERILEPIQHSLTYFKENSINSLYLIATKEVSEYIQSKGFIINKDNPQGILLTYDTELTFEKLKNATELIHKGIPYFSTHPDIVCPSPKGDLPDIGTFINLLETTTHKSPKKIFGKPNIDFIKMVLEAHNLKESDAVIIGDRLYTDIKMADGNDINSILTLSGETKREDYEFSDIRADIVVSSVEDLIKFID